jgi:hypothetical protein
VGIVHTPWEILIHLEFSILSFLDQLNGLRMNNQLHQCWNAGPMTCVLAYQFMKWKFELPLWRW